MTLPRDRNPPERRRAGPAALLAAATIVLAALTSSCRKMELRRAMTIVQTRFTALSEAQERGLREPANFEIRELGRSLERALLDERIIRANAFADETEFQSLLAETVDAVRSIQHRAKAFDAAELWDARSEISYSCQNCHDRYRGH